VQQINELQNMTPYITNSTLVDTPHLETLFHTGEKALYLRPVE
jgi:hypothetical protein